MPKITDRSLLTLGTEITVNTSIPRRIGLVQTGDLSADGVAINAVFGFLNDLWISSAVYSFYPFPMRALAVDQYELINNWDWADDTTRSLLRDGGYAVSSGGAITQEWLCALSGSGIAPTAQLYYELTGTKINFARTGEANEVIQTFKAGTGAFDSRTSGLTLFAREWGRTYAMSSLLGQGVENADYKSYLLPLQTDVDINVTELEATVAGSSPFTGVALTILPGTGFAAWNSSTNYAINAVVSRLGRWYRATASNTNSQPPSANWVSFEGEREVNGAYYPFTKIFSNTDNATLNEAYHRERWMLRQSSGTLNALTDPLMRYVGSTLYPGRGVWIENVAVNQRSLLRLQDSAGTEIAYSPVISIIGFPAGSRVVVSQAGFEIDSANNQSPPYVYQTLSSQSNNYTIKVIANGFEDFVSNVNRSQITTVQWIGVPLGLTDTVNYSAQNFRQLMFSNAAFIRISNNDPTLISQLWTNEDYRQEWNTAVLADTPSSGEIATWVGYLTTTGYQAIFFDSVSGEVS